MPQWSYSIGYTSCNVQQDFNGNGSFEIVFHDAELKQLVAEQKNELLFVKWGRFAGFLTGHQWSDSECHLYGMHINGLLKNFVVPADENEEEVNAEELVLNTVRIVNEDAEWLGISEKNGWNEKVSFPKSNYTPLDVWLQELLEQLGWGYDIAVDFAGKRFVFSLQKPTENNLILSLNNLNAHAFVETFDNKTYANGGWYAVDVEREQEQLGEDGFPMKDESGDVIMETVTVKEWRYITNGEPLSGMLRRDVVLSATTDAEAENELKTFRNTDDMTAETENIKLGVDYKIGDVVRIQNAEGVTIRRLVSGVNWWQEQSYNEKPIMTEVKVND